MLYTPTSELERTVLNYRTPRQLGKPLPIYVNELCHALFSDPVAATRAAMKKAEEMAGHKLPWLPASTAIDLQDLRCSITCSSAPELPVEYVQKGHPEFVCGWRGLILISVWAPLTLADFERNHQRPKPGDVFRRWDWKKDRYFDCSDVERFNDGYNVIEDRFGKRQKVHVAGDTVLRELEYVGTVHTEEALNG